jgi:chlorobactene glucosyltransferase
MAAVIVGAYLVAVFCINAYFLAAVLANAAYFRRATTPPRITSGPFVSVIVPARDEERLIGRCIDSLLTQDYGQYEVIVVDDQSRDGTAEAVAARAARDPRLRLVSGEPLPEGWVGKPHALSQGVAAARGEILVLADADTFHGTSSVSWAVTNLEDHRADLLSGYVKQEYGSIGESLVVPTLYASMLAVPFYLLPRTENPRFAFSVGQFVAMRREALDRVGGYEAIRDSIVDDMSMAILMKEHGYRGVFLDAKRVAGCHLYTGFGNAFGGVRRSIYSGVGGHPVAVGVVAALVLGLIVGPAAWVLVSYARSETPPYLLVASVVLFAAQWAFVAWDREVPVIAVVLYPFVFLNLLFILVASMMGTGFGHGVEWKGRLVRVPRGTRGTRGARVAAK